MKSSIAALALAALTCPHALIGAADPPPSPAPQETTEHRDARMAWWRDAKFGMFIHWGVYAVPAGYYKGQPVPGIGEWIMNRGKIPMVEYQAFAKEFNPVKFDADEWVRIAKQAGMRYIVITAKHHDGFAMFDTKASDWNIVKATPYGHDPLKALAAACRKQGIKLGFYYSQAQDWNNGGSAAGGKWDPAQDHDMDDYVDKVAVPQVREILSNYGPDFPAVLWWDTPTGMDTAKAGRIAAVVKELRPDIIMNNRLGGGFSGDTETPEQHIPAQGYPGRDWETCMTMNGTWGFKKDDANWKSAEKLIRNLCDIASKGGNYLLNVGPTPEGLIPEPSIERLKQVGAWMKVNGAAIYGSQAGPFTRSPKWGRATTKDGKVFLLVFDWPKDGRLATGLLGKIKRAALLASPDQDLKVENDPSGIVLHLPASAPDPIASAIVIEPDGPLAAAPVPLVAADVTGSIRLDASNAEIIGSRLNIAEEAQPYLGNWSQASDYVQWDIELPKAGPYGATFEYACAPEDAGSTFELSAGSTKVKGQIAPTKGGKDFQKVEIRTIEIKEAAHFTVALKITSKAGNGGALNLRSLVLAPVAPQP